ncbi:Kinesin protein, partial [Globisporangium splendens]
MNEREIREQAVSCFTSENGNAVLTNLENPSEKHEFGYDFVYGCGSLQETVFQDIGVPILDRAFGGYNGTIFAYGQTGSGKTFSMSGVSGNESLEGLIPRMNKTIFERIEVEKVQDPNKLFLVECSFFEIYNEIIYDLLDSSGDGKKNKGGLEIKEHSVLGIYVKDLQERVVESREEVIELMAQGAQARTVGYTQMNSESSRSHSIFAIKIHQKDSTDESKNIFTKINLVNLAGSERAASTGAQGDRLKEGANINKSLSALSNVVSALVEASRTGKKVFIPYRNSKLTRVLQESLGGNSLCSMLATLSPANTNFPETLSTLRYTSRVKSIKVNAKKNEASSQISQLNEDIAALKKKLMEQTELTLGLDPKEKEEIVKAYEKQIQEMDRIRLQTWENKAKLSKQHELERKRLAKEKAIAGQKIREERTRKWKLLEERGDIELMLRDLDRSPSGVTGATGCSSVEEKWLEETAKLRSLESESKDHRTLVMVSKDPLHKDVEQWAKRFQVDTKGNTPGAASAKPAANATKEVEQVMEEREKGLGITLALVQMQRAKIVAFVKSERKRVYNFSEVTTQFTKHIDAQIASISVSSGAQAKPEGQQKRHKLEQLTAAEQALRRQHFRANNKAMHDWTTATRQNRRFSLPSVDPSDVSKLTGWIPSHVDALSALICALPFPLEVLRMFPVKKLLDFRHSINSQAQRALIRHHSADDAVSAQVRAFCKKWATAVDAFPQGSARWSMTDNIKQWNRLEKLDDSLLIATVSRPIDPDKWAILNVICLLLPSMFPKHEAVGHVMPETRAEEYWPRRDNHRPRRRSATVNARHELSVGFLTQNVMGFSKSDANLNAWFSHFRQTDDSGSLDIVFLQETHVLETEVASMQSRFRRSWGFQEPSEGSDPRLSLWSASTERKGGVAILLNPYSCIPTLAPYKQDQWNAHWMAATVTLRGETVLLLNIYAPSTVFAREAFYRALSGLLSSHDGPILCGGDFNCTLNQMADRSHNTHNKVHDSRELKKLLQKLDLVDTLEDDALRATDTRDVKAFHRQHHTYYYTLPSGGSASSRLDRWYCSNDHLDWVRSVYQSVAGPFSDHNGVTIRVAAPDKVIQSKKPRVVYPLPKNAAASIGKDFFEKAHDQLDELRGRYSSPRDYALATANWWDEAKIALRIGYLEAKKSYFARLNQGYKKKIQRLQRRLSESEAQMLDHSGGAVGDQNVELSQEFLTTATSIRRAIAECKSKWQASKRDRIFREHMHHERKTSKSFYKRISTKFLDNTIFTLGGTATCGPMRSRELADDMGEGWKSIMQQAPTLQTDIDQILDPGTAIPPSDRLGFLLKPINSSEIKQAVKKCKRGKAHGPDELGNDWYRDHCDEITGLFERLFNLWIPECVLPSSFSEAHIHCIKKSVSAASPLDYTPIALLNSDYKIFTRIFATRLRTVLSWLIHHMQAGFVPGRVIPTTIDVLLAAQQRATSDPAMSRAIALLLDFAKAYDSLDRSFLAQALQHLGFPLKFVHLVKVLYSQTTYKFIVNGFLSRKYNVTSGIRQGCPLSPLLFILALEVLYRKIEASDEIHGVELQAAGCATEVRLGGYADDTTIYLSDPKDINAVFAILDKYGAASGLRVNRHKSAVLPLNKEYSSTEESVSDIHVLQREEHCRYLGIQVGQTPSNASNWSKCIQALRVRLRLARLKTHSVAQRAAIASAVIIPKVLYVARHSWPSTAIVNQLHDLVKQFIWGSRNGKPAKPWMKEEQAELKKMNGGLSVPNIRTELMTMSATAVSKWSLTTSHIDQVTGEILLHNTRASSTYITPLDAIPRRPPQLRDTMWTTGAALCVLLHSRPYEPRERDNVRWCYEHFKSTIVQTQWDGDVFQIDLSSKMSDRLPGIIAEGRRLRGTFCAEWLPYMTSTADGWLLDSNGSPYKLAHSSLSVGTAQLGDILRWEWIRPGVLNFIPTCGISGFSRPSIRALERLCATLVSNFPQLLYRPQQTNVLRLYNGQRHYNHEWHLHTSEATLTHVDTTLVKATHRVHSATDCDIMATRDLNGQKVSFHAHPRFTRIVQLWGGNGRCNTTRSFHRQQVAATRTQIGKDTRDAAVNKAVHTAGSLWPGLQLIQWSELHNIPGITVYTAQTLLRLKANRLSMWNCEKADLSCSNPECSQVVQSSVQHLFWECPKAKLVWNYFYALWAKIGITPGHDPAIWIFSLDLPDTPRHAWTTIKRHIIGHKFSNEHLQDHLYPVAHMLWRYMSASLIQPFGPGGTGSIIVRVHKDSHTASLIWAASMAYSRKDTTNNFAEYWGLIHGLREAQRSHFEPLYVIGDSALIISQQRMHRSPRQHRLARLYQTSRRLADCIDIRGWYHHYRAFNKMADSAANLAMDTRTSTQVHFPTQRAAFNNLTQDLDNDVMHWLMRNKDKDETQAKKSSGNDSLASYVPQGEIVPLGMESKLIYDESLVVSSRKPDAKNTRMSSSQYWIPDDQDQAPSLLVDLELPRFFHSIAIKGGWFNGSSSAKPIDAPGSTQANAKNKQGSTPTSEPQANKTALVSEPQGISTVPQPSPPASSSSQQRPKPTETAAPIVNAAPTTPRSTTSTLKREPIAPRNSLVEDLAPSSTPRRSTRDPTLPEVVASKDDETEYDDDFDQDDNDETKKARRKPVQAVTT